jgi:hypothetical protein
LLDAASGASLAATASPVYPIYPVALLGVIHYLWLVKEDLTEPLIYE